MLDKKNTLLDKNLFDKIHFFVRLKKDLYDRKKIFVRLEKTFVRQVYHFVRQRFQLRQKNKKNLENFIFHIKNSNRHSRHFPQNFHRQWIQITLKMNSKYNKGTSDGHHIILKCFHWE
jgi:hypothetical protein